MKNETLHTWLCSLGIGFCLSLGAVGSMVSGLDLPGKPVALVIFFLLLTALVTGLTCLRYGSLISLGISGIFLLNPDLWTELKTIAAAVALRLQLGYGIPIPELLQEEPSQQVLSALCLVGGLIMIASAWAVQRQKTAIPAVILSLLPLGCCITVIDSVPASPWLYLWGLGLVLLVITQSTRHKSVQLGNRLTAILAVPVALVLILLFILVPRDAPSRWSLAAVPKQILSYFYGGSGPAINGPAVIDPAPQSPTTVELSTLKKRLQNQTAVMDVTADFTGALYLRGRDYDKYTGTSWYSTDNRTEELYGFVSQWHQKDGMVQIHLRQARDLYYLPAITQQVQLVTDGLAPNPNLETDYSFAHCSMREDWQSSWEDPLFSTLNPRYLELSSETAIGVRDYLDSIEAGLYEQLYTLTAPETAEWIRLHLRELVPYDRFTPNMPPEENDFALWFLNGAESGYCVHYATTAAVMLRVCGIPARYVEGYALQVQKNRTVTVQEEHAHAWVEYYVKGVGWMILEVTPAGGTVPEEPTTTAPTTPTTTAPTTTPVATQPTTPTETQPPIPTPKKELPLWVKPLLMWLAWISLAVTVLWGQYRLRRRLLQRALHRGNANRQGLLIHRQLKRIAKWTGKAVPPELTQLAQKARFSHHTLTPQELSRLRLSLKLAETALSLLPLHKRLSAKWIFARY